MAKWKLVSIISAAGISAVVMLVVFVALATHGKANTLFPAYSAGAAIGQPATKALDCNIYPYAVGCPSPKITHTAPTSIYTPPPPPDPKPSDFTITLSIKSKQCFGSAGCNLVVEPALNVVGPAALGSQCDLTYSIKGNDDGELVETAYNEGGTQYRVEQTMVSTKSSKVVPSAEVTSVSCTK
jgi:hypothetical protein